VGDKIHACRLLVVESEGKRPLGRPSYRWKDNNIYFKEMVRGFMD
jgi:hypothetical protein